MIIPKNRCTVDGCENERPPNGAWVCTKHAYRKKNYGSYDAPLKHERHGLTNTPTYISWQHMIQRCTNRNHHAYSRYGGRGIVVSTRWTGSGGYSNFLADMGERPHGKTLDRINNDDGYNPTNCRWSSSKEQVNNRTAPSRAKSGYKNIHWDKHSGVWLVRFMSDGKTKHIGAFKTVGEAVNARDKYKSAIM